MDDLYYVLDGQDVVGPMKGSSVQAMAANGSLKAGSNVNRSGDSDWVVASRLDFLADYFRQAPVSTRTTYGQDYVGFWPRLGAYVIDTLILYLITLVTGFLFGVIVGIAFSAAGKDAETIKLVATAGGAVLGLVLTIWYYAGFLAGKWQATPGKRLLGMYVVRTDAQKVGWLLGLGRYFAYMLSSIIFCIGFLMIFWTDEKKALHDIVCKTRVVRGKPGARTRVVDAF